MTQPSGTGHPNVRTLWRGRFEPRGLRPGLGHLLVLAISASLGLLFAFAEQGEETRRQGTCVRGCGPEALADLAPGLLTPSSLGASLSQSPLAPSLSL